jgi:hypothetical protein
MDIFVLAWHMIRVGRNSIYAPYMTVYMMKSLPKLPYTHHIFIGSGQPNPVYDLSCTSATEDLKHRHDADIMY